jgi:hypothetical protein
MAKIRIDLDAIFSEGRVIQDELSRVIEEAVSKRIALVDIVSEKKNGELKKRVLLFLAQPQIKRLYHRIEKDDKNSGRILVHFRLRSNRKRIGLYGYQTMRKK